MGKVVTTLRIWAVDVRRRNLRLRVQSRPSHTVGRRRSRTAAPPRPHQFTGVNKYVTGKGLLGIRESTPAARIWPWMLIVSADNKVV